MDVLKQDLVKEGVEFTEKLFKTEDGIDGLSGEVFVSASLFIIINILGEYVYYLKLPFVAFFVIDVHSPYTGSRYQDICCCYVCKPC